jgi:hypothetical protein
MTINRLTFIVLCGCIAATLLIANDYENQMHANARQLATAIAEARRAASELARDPQVQYAIYKAEVAPLTKAIPAAALKDMGPAIMRKKGRT